MSFSKHKIERFLFNVLSALVSRHRNKNEKQRMSCVNCSSSFVSQILWKLFIGNDGSCFIQRFIVPFNTHFQLFVSLKVFTYAYVILIV